MALQFCFSLRAFPFVDNLQEIVITVVSSVLSVSSVFFLYPPVTKLEEGGGSILFVARTMCAFCFFSFRKSGVLCTLYFFAWPFIESEPELPLPEICCEAVVKLDCKSPASRCVICEREREREREIIKRSGCQLNEPNVKFPKRARMNGE